MDTFTNWALFHVILILISATKVTALGNDPAPLLIDGLIYLKGVISFFSYLKLICLYI